MATEGIIESLRTRFAFAVFFIATACFAGCSGSITGANPGRILRSASLPDSVKLLLSDQALRIGFRAGIEKDSSALDSVYLPNWSTARVYSALANLWQMTNLPERDTVFDVYDVREYGLIDFHSLYVCDSASIAPSQATFDKYGFARDTTLPLFFEYKTSRTVNTYAVATEANKAVGFPCLSAIPLSDGGDHVIGKHEASAMLLTYNVGYGDCYSGCIAHRYYRFRVLDNGDVKFLGASGDAPPTKDQRKN